MGEVHENVLRFVVCCYHPALLLSLFSFFHLGGHLTFLVVITKKTPKLNQNKDKSENKQPNQPQRNPDPLGWRGFSTGWLCVSNAPASFFLSYFPGYH